MTVKAVFILGQGIHIAKSEKSPAKCRITQKLGNSSVLCRKTENPCEPHRSWILFELLCKKKRGIALADCEEQEFDQPMSSCSCNHVFMPFALMTSQFTVI